MKEDEDWKTLIVQMVLVTQRMQELDAKGLWRYHHPRVAATEAEVVEAERGLGERLPSDYRSFLHHANGWPALYQAVDLFGTQELRGGEAVQRAAMLAEAIDDSVLTSSGVKREDFLPIAASRDDMDLFVLCRERSPAAGAVIWFASGEVDRFPSFREYFLALLDYNRAEVEHLAKSSGGRS